MSTMGREEREQGHNEGKKVREGGREEGRKEGRKKSNTRYRAGPDRTETT